MHDPKKVRLLIVGIISFFLLVIGISVFFYINENKNQFGDHIPIKNYDQVVSNLPKLYKDSISSSLYDIVEHNTPNKSESELSSIKDAFIREDSANQEVLKQNIQYVGSFIVDIPSIKQSYQVQYTYSKNADDPILSGYPVLVSCLDTTKLIYGDFNCKNIHEEDKTDPIIGLMPYDSLDFSASADTSTGKLIINVDLHIPSIDLAGPIDTKREAVALYKKEFINWLKENGYDVANYTIHYNYSDDGEPASIFH